MPQFGAVMLCNPLNAGVDLFGGVEISEYTNLPVAGGIGGHDAAELAMKEFLKFRQVRNATAHIFMNVEGMNDAEMLSGCRHQLHQAHGTLRGNGARLPCRLNLNDRAHEGSRNSI